MKKIFVAVSTWLRSRVTALVRVKGYRLRVEGGSRGLNENDNLVRVNGDGLRVDDNVNVDVDDDHNHNENGNSGMIEASLNAKRSSLKDSLLIRMEEYVGEHYEVRLNRLSQHYELSPLGAERWGKLDEEAIYRLMMEMNHAGIGITKPYLVRTVLQGGELVKRYHPVYDYLENLPAWDGAPHIEALFRRVTDDERLLGWLRKWFVAMVAQVMGRMGTYGNSVCPILISRQQGWGKSQFAKMLVPPQLRMFFSDTFNLAQEDACLRRMTAYMLINVDEVDRFAGRRMPIFKNLVQLSAVSMKRAYHSQMEERERMASFIATSNRRYLLNDETGSRRFICVELAHAIDVDAPLDYAQLYAEAMAAIDAGERCWFDEEETRQLEVHNAAYSVRCGVWDLLRQHFEVCVVPETPDEKSVALWSAAEVYDYLHELSPTAMEGIDRHNFGYYLKQLGAPQVRIRNRRLFGVALREVA